MERTAHAMQLQQALIARDMPHVQNVVSHLRSVMCTDAYKYGGTAPIGCTLFREGKGARCPSCTAKQIA